MKRPIPTCLFYLLIGVAVAAALAKLLVVTVDGKGNNEKKGASTEGIPARLAEVANNTAEARVFDSSVGGQFLLIAKRNPHDASAEDLWIRDASGKERWIAREVTSAKFSPDGHKIAFTTAAHEVLVETLAGTRLAEIPRATEPVWGAESATLSFSAFPSLEYPELQQQNIYDLTIGSIVRNSEPPPANASNFPATPHILNMQNQTKNHDEN